MDNSKSYWDKVEEIAGARQAAAGSGPASAGTPAVAGTSLECSGITLTSENDKNSDKVKVHKCVHIVGDRCRDWFCPRCCRVQGGKLRKKLIDRVERWHPMMLTFTVDPGLFPEGPEAAFKCISESCCIALVMRRLKKYRRSRHWFSVIEFQQNGWPHWHVLVDADFIPIKEVERLWGLQVPKSRRHLIRPSVGTMGMIRYSKPDQFKNSKHAAMYVSKYLVKYPEDGFPEWVMQARYRIRRLSTSRGFWGFLTHRSEPDPLSEPKKICRRSHIERAKGCCMTTSVFDVEGEVNEQTGELVKPKRKFIKRLLFPVTPLMDRLKELRGLTDDAGQSIGRLGIYFGRTMMSFLGTWDEFKSSFAGAVEGGSFRDCWNIRLRSGDANSACLSLNDVLQFVGNTP